MVPEARYGLAAFAALARGVVEFIALQRSRYGIWRARG